MSWNFSKEPTPVDIYTEGWTPRPLYREATWVFCDRCGCSVDIDLIRPDGHHYAHDGDFICADCWEVVTL